jgi:uncharacterized membrane protein
MAGTAAGALTIALAGLWFGTPLFVPVLVAGIAAALLDSVLGATVQGSYERADGSRTDERSEGVYSGGFEWLTNSGVNLIATAFGATTAAAVASIMVYGR